MPAMINCHLMKTKSTKQVEEECDYEISRPSTGYIAWLSPSTTQSGMLEPPNTLLCIASLQRRAREQVNIRSTAIRALQGCLPFLVR